MTAIPTAFQSSPTPRKEASNDEMSVFPPSSTEDEAKSRFRTALSDGVEILMRRGHGRERASSKLLNELTCGCSPADDEIFKAMTFGVSLNDATKMSTVSLAFRHSASRGCITEAIDDLTSRLCRSSLIHPCEALRSRLLGASTVCKRTVRCERNQSPSATRPSAYGLVAGEEDLKEFFCSPHYVGGKLKSQKGKKRSLSEKGIEKGSNSKSSGDSDPDEEVFNAKISEEKEMNAANDSVIISKAALPAGGRAKRCALCVDENRPVKRVRSTTTVSSFAAND